MKGFIQSSAFKIIIAIMGVLLIVFISFGVGVSVGLRKSRFSADFGRNYERNFMGSRFGGGSWSGMMVGRGGFASGMMRQFEGREFRNGYGLAGTIISITDNTLIIKDRDNKENVVTVNDKTLIKYQRDDLKMDDLKVDDEVVVMGKPGGNGTVNASLIRVFINN